MAENTANSAEFVNSLTPASDGMAVASSAGRNDVVGRNARASQTVHKVFGKFDTTPWACLWLALVWAVVELIPGMALLQSEFAADLPNGNSIMGAVFSAATFATGGYWIWFAIVGSISVSRRWQLLVASCMILIASRLLLPPPLQTLVAVFAWAMLGTMGTALGVRYLLGFNLTPKNMVAIANRSAEFTSSKSELSIWMLLRYTLAAAVLAWFTRSVGKMDEGVLSSLEIVCLGIPLGLINGGLSFVIIWMLSRSMWWIHLGVFISLFLPICGAATLFTSMQFATHQMLIFAVFAAAVSLLAHLILFGLPLAAMGFYFGAGKNA